MNGFYTGGGYGHPHTIQTALLIVFGTLYAISWLGAYHTGKLADDKGYSKFWSIILVIFTSFIGVVIIYLLPYKDNETKNQKAFNKKADELGLLFESKKITKKEYDEAIAKALQDNNL